MKLWVVGKNKQHEIVGWEFMGIFDSEDKAIAACKNKHYFVGEAILNQDLTDEKIEWPGAYYPKNS